MDFHRKKACSVSIIGGSDGPTSIFLGGKQSGLRGIISLFQSKRYQRKRSHYERKISIEPHTLDEVIQYADKKYSLTELHTDDKIYQARMRECKQRLVQNYAPELLNSISILTPLSAKERENKETLNEWFLMLERQSYEISELIEAIPADIFPMDFHLYRIKTDTGELKLETERTRAHFAVSGFSCSENAFEELLKIEKELYLYFGVTAADAANHSIRYDTLLTILMS